MEDLKPKPIENKIKGIDKLNELLKRLPEPEIEDETKTAILATK